MSRPLPLREYVGRYVRLAKDIRTRGGDQWNAGEVLRVTGTWRSGVTLAPVSPDPMADARLVVSQVPRGWVYLLAPHEAMATLDDMAIAAAPAVARRETERAIAAFVRESVQSVQHSGLGDCQACAADRLATALEASTWRDDERAEALDQGAWTEPDAPA